jgi:hypothetical protein
MESIEGLPKGVHDPGQGLTDHHGQPSRRPRAKPESLSE